jgi:isoleucyl-tRNA synthetase
VAIISSPIAPFFMDQLFMDLNRITSKSPFNSVHHCSFPTLKQNELDRALESRMTIAQRLSSLALGLRKKEKIRVRQPLAQLLVPALSAEFSESVREIQDLILSEVNIKSLRLIEDDGTMLVKNIKPNFKSIGKKYGAQMKGISSLVAGFDQEIIRQIEQKGNWVCHVDGVELALELADFEISAKDIPGWLVANDGELTVALDITITEELRAEGIAREFVNRIQNIRKEKQFDVTDRIRINYSSSLAIERAIEANQSYICAEVLADELVLTKQFASQILIDIDESGDTKVDLQLVTN